MRARRTLLVLTTVAAAAGVATSGTAVAQTPPHGLSGADVRFLDANTQVDLTEIGAARIVLSRTHDPAAGDLARRTLIDHQIALSRVRTIARRLGLELPTAPNSMQQQVAAELESVPVEQLPLAYFTAQVAGHLKSISGTRHEIAYGSKQSVISYAVGYLPVATMHLQMSRQDLARAS